MTTLNNGQIHTSLERKIPLITIKSISLSNLRDDWLVSIFLTCHNLSHYFDQVLNCNASEEGDPVLHCYFKTEFVANLLQLTQASISVLAGPA